MIVILIAVIIAKVIIIIINDTSNNKNGDSINIGTDFLVASLCYCFIHAWYKSFFSKRFIDFPFIKTVWSISCKFIHPVQLFFPQFF